MTTDESHIDEDGASPESENAGGAENISGQEGATSNTQVLPKKVRIQNLEHIRLGSARGSGALVLGRSHSFTRAAREQKSFSQLVLWSSILALCLVAVAYNVISGQGEGGNLDSQSRAGDYMLFFIMLFVTGRFLTSSAAVIVIASVAAFHVLERIHYRDLPPPGITGHHVRYFMLMYIFCFVFLRTIAGAREFLSSRNSSSAVNHPGPLQRPTSYSWDESYQH